MKENTITTDSRCRVVEVQIPRYRARFTAYIANADFSSTCITVECEHGHVSLEEAHKCGERLRFRVEHNPHKVPAVAAELARRGM